MTQSEIERAASAHAKDLLDMCDSKNWVEMSGEDYKRTIKNTFLAGAEHARARWIKCSERMPEPHSDVLVCELVGDEVVMAVSHWWSEVMQGAVGEIILTHWFDDGEPSYWMPLPAAPEAERK